MSSWKNLPSVRKSVRSSALQIYLAREVEYLPSPYDSALIKNGRKRKGLREKKRRGKGKKRSFLSPVDIHTLHLRLSLSLPCSQSYPFWLASDISFSSSIVPPISRPVFLLSLSRRVSLQVNVKTKKWNALLCAGETATQRLRALYVAMPMCRHSRKKGAQKGRR